MAGDLTYSNFGVWQILPIV